MKPRSVNRPLDDALAVLNGVVGSYLARSANGLATEMSLVKDGLPLPVRELANLGRRATRKVVVLVHGLASTEGIFRHDDGEDYGTLLQKRLRFTPLYVRYNSGLAIAENGAALSRLLEEVVAHHPAPIDELLLVGYSMGGLVIRSACHQAEGGRNAWLPWVSRAIYVGTPHRGAPLERVGRVVQKVLRAVDDPYTRLAAELANLRSDGVKDLGDADLRHEDRTRPAGWGLRDVRHPVPLLPTLRHCLIAGSLSADPWLSALFGDSIVPVASATNAPELGLTVKVLNGFSHLDLPKRREVYVELERFLKETGR